ncbi:MAG: response regulator [Enhydrobacter sp.]|nr:response regulator [Enhydrobacter sp.]
MGAPVRVLVVDDSDDVRDSILLSLKRAGCAVNGCARGEEAVRMLAQEAYDVVVADLWMPGLDGVELTKIVRRDYPGTRVIAISGGGPGISLEANAALVEVWGAEATFVKPFDNELLIAQILSPAADR